MIKKNKYSRLIAILLVVLILCLTVCSGCGSKPSADDSSDGGVEALPLLDNTGKARSSFVLDITLDTEQHKLDVAQSISYPNNTGAELDEIYFNLIPDAFQNDGGGIDMERITAGGESLSLEQVKETVYKLTLPEALPSDARLDIQMDYTVNIPNIKNRFGYQESSYNLGNFIVTPAVYDADGWAVEPYVDIGDAFYTDIADYEVRINAPEGFTVAAAGEEVESGLYRARSVRDFAFCAGDSYKTLTDTQNGVAITVYYADDIEMTARRALDVAKVSLELCCDTFGDYPYKTLSVVMGGLVGGVNGMEYPTLVMISPEIPIEEYYEMDFNISDSAICDCLMASLDRSICHEIAHQWFYGIVGNDQITEPWLDEGLCRYSEYLYQEAYLRVPSPEFAAEYGVYPMTDMFEYIHGEIASQAENESGGKADTAYTQDTAYLDKSLYYWADEDPMGYSQIYDKGACLIYEMRRQMGAESFDAALKDYVRSFAYDFVTKESFVQFWSEKGDFSQLFELYLG